MTTGRLDHRIAAPGLAAMAFLLLTLAVAGHAGAVLRFDAAISEAAHRTALAHPHWRALLYAITLTGGTGFLAPVVAFACLPLLWRRRLRQACFVAVTLPITLTIRILVLNLIDRPRPADRLAPSGGWSYPSGHSAASATVGLMAVIVCWPLLGRRWMRAVCAGLAGGWAAAVGWSRVGLVVHWPSDVIGAWLLVMAIVPTIAALLRVLPAPRSYPL